MHDSAVAAKSAVAAGDAPVGQTELGHPYQPPASLECPGVATPTGDIIMRVECLMWWGHCCPMIGKRRNSSTQTTNVSRKLITNNTPSTSICSKLK